MYVLIVTEVLEDWEDSVNIGKALFVYLSEWGSYGQSSQAVTCLTVAFFFFSFFLPGLSDITVFSVCLLGKIIKPALFLPL